MSYLNHKDTITALSNVNISNHIAMAIANSHPEADKMSLWLRISWEDQDAWLFQDDIITLANVNPEDIPLLLVAPDPLINLLRPFNTTLFQDHQAGQLPSDNQAKVLSTARKMLTVILEATGT